MKKRIMSLVMAVVMLVGIAPIASASANVFSGEGWHFDAATGTLTVSAPEGSRRWWIDSNIDAVDVKTLVLEDTVTSINAYAFDGCVNLTTITIPDSTLFIGTGAFRSCGSLTSINVGEANDFFTSVDGVLFDKDKTTLIQYPIGKSMISEGYTIPDGVTKISDWAFFNSRLTSVAIPDSVTEIGDAAFRHCTTLTSVTIGNSVTTIGDYAFAECMSLESVIIPDSVTLIGDAAFNGTNLTSVIIPENVTQIGEGAFSAANLTFAVIRGSVTNIGSCVFWGCENLTHLIFASAEPPSFDPDAFSHTPRLTTIYVPVGSIAAYKAVQELKEYNIVEACVGDNCGDCELCKLAADNPDRIDCADCDKCKPEVAPNAGKTGYVLGNAVVSTADALEILKYIVRLPGAISECENAKKAATIMGNPIGTADALEILKHIVKLPNKIDGTA